MSGKAMKSLVKSSLDFQKAHEYFRDSLLDVNSLSSNMLKYFDFTDGTYYTLLPADARPSRLYEFSHSGILPQNPKKEVIKNGIRSFYSITPSLEEAFSELILEKITETNVGCVVDDVIRDFDENHYVGTENAHRFCYGNELYYTLGKAEASTDLIKSCLLASKAFWHSLCVLTTFDFQPYFAHPAFTDDMLKKICQGISFVMVGAYDGEGYVIWERHSSAIKS